MFKAIFLAFSIVAVTAGPSFAENDNLQEGTAAAGDLDKGSTERASRETGAVQDIQYFAPPKNEINGLDSGTGWQDWGSSRPTTNNGMRGGDGGNNNGPDMRPLGGRSYGDRSNQPFMSMGGSGAATGAPIIQGGANTFQAPSNLALQTQLGAGKAMKKYVLPKTNLDSFVYQAHKIGKAQDIYGDEGVYDKPPFDHFLPKNFINKGIHGENAKGLTTGHKATDNPSAWGTPLKYNKPAFNPIYGENGGF